MGKYDGVYPVQKIDLSNIRVMGRPTSHKTKERNDNGIRRTERGASPEAGRVRTA